MSYPIGTLGYIVDARWRHYRTSADVLGLVVTVTGFGQCQCDRCVPGDNDRVCTLRTADGDVGCLRTWAAFRPITPPGNVIDEREPVEETA